jgi:hypothetical protein
MRVRHRDDHRLFGEIQPSARIERVEVGPDHDSHFGGRVRPDVGEHIHGVVERDLVGLYVSQLLTRDVHRNKGIQIDIGIDPDGVGLLLRDGLRCTNRC